MGGLSEDQEKERLLALGAGWCSRSRSTSTCWPTRCGGCWGSGGKFLRNARQGVGTQELPDQAANPLVVKATGRQLFFGLRTRAGSPPDVGHLVDDGRGHHGGRI